MDFGTKIKELREQSGLTQKQMSEILGVSKSNISKYESNAVEPSLETLKNYAIYFSISADYLLGVNTSAEQLSTKTNISDGSTGEGHRYFFFFFDNLLRDTFVSRLKKAIAENGISIDEFSKIVSFDENKCNSYLNGENEPSLEDLLEISRVLDVSIEYLLGQSPRISTSENKLLNAFRKLNEDNQDILIGKVKELLKDQRYEVSVAAEEPMRKASGK